MAMLPYVDRNPSRAFEDRKISITVFTIFAIYFAVTVLAGSFFRGSGWQWIWPWQHIYSTCRVACRALLEEFP